MSVTLRRLPSGGRKLITHQAFLPKYLDEVKREAARREIQLLILPTAEAVEALRQNSDNTNAILHVTC